MDARARLGGIAPFFIVSDVRRAVEFYTEQLAFGLELMGPEGDPYFAIVARDDVRLMLKAIRPDVQPMPNPSRHHWAKWDAFVSVDDPAGLAAEFAGRGVALRTSLGRNADGLFGFELADADGYVLYFGRPATTDDPE